MRARCNSQIFKLTNFQIVLFLIFHFSFFSASAQKSILIPSGTDSIWVSKTVIGTSVLFGGAGTATRATSLTNGLQNTEQILLTLGTNSGQNYAAMICDTLKLEGYFDWYLPAIDEVNAIYANNVLFSFSTSIWSSSEVDKDFAWRKSFSTGTDYQASKYSGYDVVCVRQRLSSEIVLSDPDGNNYATVEIGTQIWMKENLRTKTYNDGSAIPIEPDKLTWASLSTPAACSYNNASETDTINTFGMLYNGYAVETNKLCPLGWHVPSVTDWAKLFSFAGGADSAAYKLKEKSGTYWPAQDAIDQYDFSAIPSGERSYMGNFNAIGSSLYLWTSTKYNNGYGYYMNMNMSDPAVSNTWTSNKNGYAVRCVKNSFTNGFTYTVNNTTRKVDFLDTTSLPVICNWEFGNSSFSAEKNIAYTYGKGGYYRVTQSVLDTTLNIIGQTEKIIYINDGTNDCEAEYMYTVEPQTKSVTFTSTTLGVGITDLIWDFGDMTTDTGTTITHTYKSDDFYTVCLTAKGATCKNITCSSIKSGSETSRLRPDFIYVTENNINKVYFNDKSSGAVKWLWDFGDGNSSTEANPVHVFSDTGLYKVKLQITNVYKEKQTTVKFVNVHSEINTLKALFVPRTRAIPVKGVLPIEFKGAGYGDAAEVEWIFGDDDESTTSMSPMHQYDSPGKYYVCMTVKDSLLGQEDTYCDSVEVVVTGINADMSVSASSEFEMWPNPASHLLTVFVSTPLNEQSMNRSPSGVEVTNTLGQTILHQHISTLSHQHIDVTQFQPGLYFVRINNTVKKLIINR